VLVVFAVTSMGVYGIVLAGWARTASTRCSAGLRASAQMISYELSYATSLAAVILLAGSLSLREIVDPSRDLVRGAAAVVPLPAADRFHHLRDCRCRRDQPRAVRFPEAEQELVAGYNTEYSSVRFALFPQAEYINMVTMSAVATISISGVARLPFTRGSAHRDTGWLAVSSPRFADSSSSTSGCGGRSLDTATTS
jgi:NADH-quinone oxidoreductase subunit H